MDEKEKYNRLVGALRESIPGLTGREELEERIMERVAQGARQSLADRAGRILFGWREVGWIRRSLSTAAGVIMGLFIFQQVSINQRISQLEDRVITIDGGTDTQGSGRPSMEKILINMVTRDPAIVDSIIVSRSDLEE